MRNETTRFKKKKQQNFQSLPENVWIAHMLWIQGLSLHELVAQAVVEGAVELRGTAMSLQHPETLHLLVPIHQQLGLVPIDPN